VTSVAKLDYKALVLRAPFGFAQGRLETALRAKN
jgi:hypothetical protein